MKKQLVLTSAMAATLSSLAGCSSGDDWDGNVIADNDTRVCVDQNGQRIEDSRCNNRSTYRSGHSGGWYYIARRSPVPYYGDSVSDKRFVGSATADPFKSYASAPSATNLTRSAAVSRGGFGSSSRSFGGGRS